jgi:catechol 2,3-dioxygenase-like lactoylglutathione lyase family enzyme
MDLNIHASFLPHDDPDASLAFYRDVLGFEVRGDVGKGTMQASAAEIVQEPTEQPYGVRDCAVRDPAGNMLRVQELR